MEKIDTKIRRSDWWRRWGSSFWLERERKCMDQDGGLVCLPQINLLIFFPTHKKILIPGPTRHFPMITTRGGENRNGRTGWRAAKYLFSPRVLSLPLTSFCSFSLLIKGRRRMNGGIRRGIKVLSDERRWDGKNRNQFLVNSRSAGREQIPLSLLCKGRRARFLNCTRDVSSLLSSYPLRFVKVIYYEAISRSANHNQCGNTCNHHRRRDSPLSCLFGCCRGLVLVMRWLLSCSAMAGAVR